MVDRECTCLAVVPRRTLAGERPRRLHGSTAGDRLVDSRHHDRHVEDLRRGKDAVEERARAELGLIKPDEIFYQVVEPAPGEAKAGKDKKDDAQH